MSTNKPTASTVDKPDPWKPWKAAGTFVAAVIVAVYFDLRGRETLDGMDFNDWLMAVLGGLVVAIVTYIIPNPRTKV